MSYLSSCAFMEALDSSAQCHCDSELLTSSGWDVLYNFMSSYQPGQKAKLIRCFSFFYCLSYYLMTDLSGQTPILLDLDETDICFMVK